MKAVEILNTLQGLGVTAKVRGDKLVVEPGSLVPQDLVPEISARKSELMELVAPTACTCDPLPSQRLDGHLAQAGCGPEYEFCERCGHRWQCKLCLGCRYCRTPG